mmetsp:Transcript_46553/g.148602  ORF Transcript_46553/g.148602 Transcript_46553/m.148602 type:complete len:396 (+) Transcript_46553:333-1520(+)
MVEHARHAEPLLLATRECVRPLLVLHPSHGLVQENALDADGPEAVPHAHKVWERPRRALLAVHEVALQVLGHQHALLRLGQGEASALQGDEGDDSVALRCPVAPSFVGWHDANAATAKGQKVTPECSLVGSLRQRLYAHLRGRALGVAYRQGVRELVEECTARQVDLLRRRHDGPQRRPRARSARHTQAGLWAFARPEAKQHAAQEGLAAGVGASADRGHARLQVEGQASGQADTAPRHQVQVAHGDGLGIWGRRRCQRLCLLRLRLYSVTRSHELQHPGTLAVDAAGGLCKLHNLLHRHLRELDRTVEEKVRGNGATRHAIWMYGVVDLRIVYGCQTLRPNRDLPVVCEARDHHAVERLLAAGTLVMLQHIVEVRLYDAPLSVTPAAESHGLGN